MESSREHLIYPYMQGPPIPLEEIQYAKKNSTIVVNVKEAPTHSEEADRSSPAYNWQPGVRARFPWIGFAAIKVVLLCICLTIVILATSDNKAQEQWPSYEQAQWLGDRWKKRAQLSPSVALAITNTIANLALTTAIGQGVVIAWWRKALKGATIGGLHQSWGFSVSAVELLTAGRSFNVIALAALTAKVALLDNLLLQRAAETVPGFFNQTNVHIRLPIAQNIPSKFFGQYFTENFSTVGGVGSSFSTAISPEYSQVLHDYSTVGDLVAIDRDWSDLLTRCDGICDAIVPCFGVDVQCDEPAVSMMSMDTAIAQTMTMDSTGGDEDNNQPTMVGSDFAFPSMDNPGTEPVEYVQMNITWSESVGAGDQANDPSATSCTLRTMLRVCQIRPAVVDYTITVTNQTGSTDTVRGADSATNPKSGRNVSQVTVTDRSQYSANASVTERMGALMNGQVWDLQIVEVLPSTPDASLFMPLLWNSLTALFSSATGLVYDNSTGYLIDSANSSPGNFAIWWPNLVTLNSDQRSCVMAVAEPTAYIVSQMNSILFRSSIAFATPQSYGQNGDNITSPFVQQVPATQTVATLIYQTNWSFLAAAVALMLFCVLCVLPSYWGFWELGRKVTLGPMDIASAFRAPDLHTDVAARGAEITDLMKDVGSRRVQYGIVEGSGRLGVAPFSRVEPLSRP